MSISRFASPATPRLAATVMLLRYQKSESGVATSFNQQVEVFMLRRASTMAFASNAVVFPGGQVAESDCDLDVSWIGPDASYWARRMNCDEVTARSLVVAAIREVFEETGVLFAGSDSQSVACELDSGSWADERKRLTRTDESFAAVLRRHDLALRADLLGLRSNWLTPESSPMRYDTFFFAAMLPDGQEPDANTSE
ncbi:MAG: NUDIX hydrolase, partial [Propionibacteriaceae bacterium]|nr:NUDIX hydrolase [Propionibacteriaceae bacterium]